MLFIYKLYKIKDLISIITLQFKNAKNFIKLKHFIINIYL